MHYWVNDSIARYYVIISLLVFEKERADVISSTSRRNYTLAIDTLEEHVFESFLVQTMKGGSLSNSIQTILRALEEITVIAFLQGLFDRTFMVLVSDSRKKSLAV